MKQITTNFIQISFLDAQTVLIEVADGVDLNAEKIKQSSDLIANEIPGEYGIIVNRKADYSLVPVEMYNMLNRYKMIKAIAIVLNGKKNVLPENTEKFLFKGELSHFQTIKEAHDWIFSVLNK